MAEAGLRFAPNETLPYIFFKEDVDRIFAAIHNLKHLCMFQVLFYACLRAPKLCNLDEDDLDLKNLTARIREEEGVREGAGFMVEDYCRALEMTN